MTARFHAICPSCGASTADLIAAMRAAYPNDFAAGQEAAGDCADCLCVVEHVMTHGYGVVTEHRMALEVACA